MLYQHDKIKTILLYESMAPLFIVLFTSNSAKKKNVFVLKSKEVGYVCSNSQEKSGRIF
jgi:hypothetical protein